MELLKEEIDQLRAENEALRSKVNESDNESLVESTDVEPIVFEPKPPLETYINEDMDVNQFILRNLAYYEIDLPVETAPIGSNKNMVNVTVGESKFQGKITNNKFMVKFGGGWISLGEYIERYIVKMQASKKSKSSVKLQVLDLDKSTKSSAAKEKEIEISFDGNLSIKSNKSNTSKLSNKSGSKKSGATPKKNTLPVTPKGE